MPQAGEITVGSSGADVIGTDSRAIQLAVDALWSRGGGTVRLLAGAYEMFDAVHLRPGISLAGEGRETILRKCAGSRSPMTIDADYAQLKVTVADARGFQVGMGVTIKDKGHGSGWGVTTATITAIEGNTLHIDNYLVNDYSADAEGVVANTFCLVSGIDVADCVVSDLTADGDRAENPFMDGCRGGGVYFQRAKRCAIRDCVVRGFNGDGVSFQTTQDITVERCVLWDNGNFGIHPGTGSARSVIRNCHMHHNDKIGFFLCWRVQHGEFSDNLIEDNGVYGISIGHKDTDNLFTRNVIRRNGRNGICFRNEKETNAGHRNTFRQNVIEDNGGPEHGCGVHIDGETHDLLFEENTFRDTRSGPDATQRQAVSIGPKAAGVMLRKNTFAGLAGPEVVSEGGPGAYTLE
jgi:polygalacturonase